MALRERVTVSLLCADADALVRREASRAEIVRLAEGVTGVNGISLVAACPDCDRDHGRPVLVSPVPVWASVSHAHCGGSWRTAVAVMTSGPVGIDLESAEQPAERVAAIREVTGYRGEDAVRHWTRIEAVLKADGRGLRIDPEEIEWVDNTAVLGGVRWRVLSDRRGPWWVSVAQER